jgi:hypothetical protein
VVEGQMADESAAGDRKLKVFISYSRKDEDFAQQLLAGLELDVCNVIQ